MIRHACLGLLATWVLACTPGEDDGEDAGSEGASDTSSGATTSSTSTEETSIGGSDSTSGGADEDSGGRPTNTSSGSTAAESSTGDVPTDCFSPTRAPETAYDDGAVGCECDDAAKSVCIEHVAFACADGRWTGVEDGACALEPACRGRLRDLDLCLAHFDVCIRDGEVFCGLDPDPDACPNGLIVDDEADCLQDAACTMLPSGAWCTGSGESMCPAPFVDADTPCPTDTFACFMWAEGFYCRLPDVSVEACEEAGGEPLYDPGDGSISLRGCPDDRQELGFLTPGGGEGALCCAL